MMGIVMPETCWASNKICNKTSVASSWHFISTCLVLVWMLPFHSKYFKTKWQTVENVVACIEKNTFALKAWNFGTRSVKIALISCINKVYRRILLNILLVKFYVFWPRISICSCKKNQLDAQFIFILLSWLRSNPARETDSHLKRTISTNCCKPTAYLLMMGCRYALNMQRFLTKYTEDKLYIKLVFLYTNFLGHF